MKVKFSKDVSFVPEFGGNRELPAEEQVSATMRVLSTGDLLVVMDAFQNAGVDGQVDTERLDVSKMKDMLALVPLLLPKYVTLTNLLDEHGAAISTDDVVSSSVFMPLQIELLMQLSVISTPSDQSVKN
jgi:hypothetical protein